MKGWSPSWNLFSSSSFSSSSSGHSLLCMFLLCPSHSCISIIHVGNNQYGKYCLFLSQQYLSLFHYYQNIGFVWDGTMPSFFFKKTNTLLYYLPCHWAGARGGVRQEHSGQWGYMSCWGVCWAVIEKSCFPVTCAVSFLLFTFLLLFVWNKGERLEVELPCWTMRLGPHVTLVKQKDRGNLSTVFALSLSPLWTDDLYSIRMCS